LILLSFLLVLQERLNKNLFLSPYTPVVLQFEHKKNKFYIIKATRLKQK